MSLVLAFSPKEGGLPNILEGTRSVCLFKGINCKITRFSETEDAEVRLKPPLCLKNRMLSHDLQLELDFGLCNEPGPPKLFPCYTLGYLGHEFSLVEATINALNARLVDIRFAPRSQIAEWNEDVLLRTFPDLYLHIPELGNQNYKTSGPIAIVDLKAGIQNVLEELRHRPVVLLCACRRYERCHRSYIAAALKSVNVRTHELAVFKVETGSLP